MAERIQTWLGSFRDINPRSARERPAVEVDVSARPVKTAVASSVAPARQALFEFDPVTGLFNWAEPESAARLFGEDLGEGQPGAQEALTGRDEVSARIHGGSPACRESAYNGEQLTYCVEYQIERPDRSLHAVEERAGWLTVGTERRLIGVIRSLEREKQHAAQLAWRAEFDELTGVYNRTELRSRLDAALGALKADADGGVYLLAGIDDLGSINSDFGFEAADVVIREIAARLSGVVGDKGFIGRVAGTKFGILVADASAAKVREICTRLLNVCRESVVETQRGSVAVSICIGAVSVPQDGRDANGVMSRAEASLDEAKRKGRSSWAAFNDKTDIVSTRRRNSHMSDVILTALNERRVRLAFQPIVSDLGEAATKYECLIRMRAEDGREVPAPEFIPVAERLGLVHLLDRRVLELAINTLAVCPNIRLNVNISMETVKDPLWAQGYISLMRAHERLAQRITVELTETQVIDAVDASIEFVTEIKEIGASFGIDDFGAGYTSFRNLKALDIDILKIDGSFVTGVSASRENQLFVRTLLDLARNFGMKTVAEWVDNEADAMLLKGLGVDFLQGYLIGKPETSPDWLPDGAPNDPPKVLRG